MKIKDKEYGLLTDDSRLVNKKWGFVLTSQNKIYKKKVEEKGCAFFLTPQKIFKNWDLKKIKIIGITGTNGKTTTTNIIAHILKKSGKKVAVSGTEGIFLHSDKKIKKIVGRGNTTPDIFTTLVNLKKAKRSWRWIFCDGGFFSRHFPKKNRGYRFFCKSFYKSHTRPFGLS